MEDKEIITRLRSIAKGATDLAQSIEAGKMNIADKICVVGALRSRLEIMVAQMQPQLDAFYQNQKIDAARLRQVKLEQNS